MQSVLSRHAAQAHARLLLAGVMLYVAAAGWLPAQAPMAPAQGPAPTGTNPPQTITAQTFTDLARKVIPSVVTVYVKRDLTKSLTPEQRQELDRLRKFFRDPKNRPSLPFEMPGQDDENGDSPQGEGQGGGDEEGGLITQGSGSGVIVSADGYILTNWHVVGDKKDQAEIRVVLSDNTELSGKDVQLINSSQFIDLALLKINRSGLTPIPFGDSERVQIGDWVATVGSPLELKATITQGIVSAKHRALGNGLGDMIQTDAPINPGSSGGALVNLSGELIGVNRMIATLSQAGGWAGYGFAIPSNQARSYFDQIRTKGEVSFGYIGIMMASEAVDSPKMRQALGLDPAMRGVLVMGTTPGSPAAEAGLQEGDFITAVDGQRITDANDLLTDVARRPVGSTVRLTYLRPGADAAPKEMTATLKITKRPTEEELASTRQPGRGGQGQPQPREQGNRLGVEVQPYDGKDGPGLKITAVQPGSAAEKAGLQPGDVLLRLNFIPLRTPQDLQKALQSRKKGSPLPLTVLREGQKVLIPID